MIVGYFVPVDSGGFSTFGDCADGRELWCTRCATPYNPNFEVPANHIAIEDHQVLDGESCKVCSKGLS